MSTAEFRGALEKAKRKLESMFKEMLDDIEREAGSLASEKKAALLSLKDELVAALRSAAE
ncbi:MAG: hypothetical protein ABWW70_01160 [Thermoproteota archaeon]